MDCLVLLDPLPIILIQDLINLHVYIIDGLFLSSILDDSTLPPGPPVYLDAIWVPGYLVRVPQSLIVEFFIRVRAKLYILSGEALHPNIAEALITAKTKWNPDGK